MRVGIGLPNAVPGAGGALLLEWARQAEAGPFTCLGVLDRLRYDSFEPLAALAAAAAVTTRVRLATTIVIAPLRNTALLAQSAATVDALSGGRLVLGLAVGAREDDYTTASVPYHTRGERLAEQLRALRDHWEGGVIGPRAGRLGGPELLLGGLSAQTFARVARYADGYVHNGGPPRAFTRAAEKMRAAWGDVGRPGRPQLWGQGYFALGAGAAESGAAYLREYYAFTGPFAEKIAAGLLTTPQAVAQYVRGYAEAGCDELVLLPTVPDLAQVAALAEVLAELG
jgi:alkanesulfonate monooxygenase SsuD/methylene tetrahydromethanopterin reductase-like flavin-dependent oxidoreductase (luciferase family)